MSMQATDPDRCAGCGGPIAAVWIEALGKRWHPEHFRCRLCSRHIDGTFIDMDGTPAHRECYLEHRAPRCVPCKRPIEDSYVVDLWGQNSCARCQASGTCDYCGGGLRALPWERRGVCPTCAGLAVRDAATARRLYAEVVAWAEGKRFFENFAQPPMRLCSREQISRDFPDMLGAMGIAQKSMWETPTGMSVKAEQVVIREGLPAPLFQMVAAHELGHVWIAAHGVTLISAQEEEGFCEVLSYLWTADHCRFGRDGILRQIAESTDPVYGDGFRMMKAIEQRIGLIGMMQSLVGRSRIGTHLGRRASRTAGGGRHDKAVGRRNLGVPRSS
ncbi:MAG: protein DA1 [Sphingomonas sp.]